MVSLRLREQQQIFTYSSLVVSACGLGLRISDGRVSGKFASDFFGVRGGDGDEVESGERSLICFHICSNSRRIRRLSSLDFAHNVQHNCSNS